MDTVIDVLCNVLPIIIEDFYENTDSDSSSSDSSDEEERRQIIKMKHYMQVIARMAPDTFKSHFRLSRTSFEIVRHNILPHYRVRKVRLGSHGISVEKSLLLTLWTLANQESFRGVGDRFDITRSNAHTHFLYVCKCLLKLANEYLHWPSEAEFRRIKQKFTTLRTGHSFPNVVGAVDCAHIPIPAPMEDAASYYNRKGFHSINLQGIADAEWKFIDVFVGWPGSSHDARVWRESPVGHGLEEDNIRVPEGTHLLGDSAYPLRSYLMTPFRDNGHLTQRQTNYNTKLSSKRIVIEQAFGMLKGRFRRLRFLYMFLMNEMQTVVIACCILHNICIIHNDTYEFDDYVLENEQDNEEEQADRRNVWVDGAADKRNEIVDFLHFVA